MGRFLIYIGVIFLAIGLVITALEKIITSGIPTLPGDILIQKKNYTIYIPLATSLLLSIILTLVLNIIGAIISKR